MGADAAFARRLTPRFSAGRRSEGFFRTFMEPAIMWRTAIWGGCCAVLLAASSAVAPNAVAPNAVAQDAALDQIYGTGVEAYYSGNYAAGLQFALLGHQLRQQC